MNYEPRNNPLFALDKKKTMHNKRLIVVAAGGYYFIKDDIYEYPYFLITSFENQTSNIFQI